MKPHRLRSKSPQLVMAFGAVLFAISVFHHGTEVAALNGTLGPLAAWLLDGPPALALVYTGYWLGGTDLSPRGQWRVFTWCLLGSVLFAAVMGLSLLVRLYEGRVIGEAVFPLLLAAEAGGIAGAVSGYQTSRSRAEARRARTVSDALWFVNSLIRHDLRNDLNVIQGHAEMLDTRDSPDDGLDSPEVIADKADEALTRIETTGAVAETLVGDPELDRVDLAAITTEMATRVENTYSIPVTTDLADTARVNANRGLRSVVDNLLENAVEHNDADEPRIEVGIDTDGESVRLTVADNGPGIPDERKETVLYPGSGETEGGGLSLVRTLVEGYDGSVRVEDNEPRGSRFVVELPRATAGRT